MRRITLLLGITLASILADLAAAISLSVSATEVLVSTSVDCEWSATLADPANFSLVMQFSNGPTDLQVGDQTTFLTTIQRGNTTSGTVPGITNVIHLGPHRLAAYADPFDATFPPFSVSPVFQVVESLTTNSTTTDATPTLILQTALGTSATAVSTSSASKTENRNIIIIVVVLVCAALLICIPGTTLLLLHRRKARELDLVRGRPFSTSQWSKDIGPPPGGVHSRNASGSSVAYGLDEAKIQPPEAVRAETRGLRLQREVPPPSYFTV